MINRDAVINSVAVTGFTDGAIDKAIIDYSINPTATYISSSSLIVNKAAIQVLEGMLSLASIKEGGYEINYSIEGVKLRLAYLNNSIGASAVIQPNIRNASCRW